MRTSPRAVHVTSIAAAVAALCSGCMNGSDLRTGWTGPPFSAELIDPAHPSQPGTRVYLGDGKARFQSEDTSSLGALVLDPASRTTLLIMDQRHSYIDAGLLTPVVTAAFAPVLRFFRPAGTGDPCTQWNTTVSQFAAFVKHDKSEPPPHFTCHSLGDDKVDGRPTHKWAVTTDGPHGGTGTVWIDDKLQIVSKSEDSDGQMEMRNIHEGPQPASLFAPPAGYKKLSVTSMLGNLMNGSSGNGPKP